MSSDFLEQFTRQKDEFLQELQRGNIEVNFKPDGNVDSKKIILELFEQWLQRKAAPVQEQVTLEQEDTQTFDVFLDEVLSRAKKILKERGIHIAYTSLSKKMGITESWKCIRVFGRSNIYYRIGKTRPRKGPNKGREYLVIDLVMDGNKKQVFVPLLKKKDLIENQLGVSLERELPKVEATGKYRLKLLLPYDVVRERNKRLAAKKLADFVEATKPHLDELGVV
ncbi:hypothetical protein [Desulfoscipio geothermicus]|uniref:Uncharacterized protein n=1 Tax=Desulfoscipio geothermicus DSM 3669 TaxID=1121426 RepID=A0A1I6D4J6_9FIRM|nr:hypothetical protein [Desulfoscipio geothermicus]SFR00404.1 hypothetical protein SAMN05660706_10596 [Desulfoscipio geothermicus DSM 3669]